MRAPLVVLMLLVWSPAQADDQRAPSIVGGAVTTAFPAVVGVLVSNGGYCTGTLVAPNVVLTAAHCVADFIVADTPWASEIAFGDGAFQWTEQIGTSDMIMERSYAPPAFQRFDIALVRMVAPAPLSVTPRSYNRVALDESYVGLPINVVGFGLGAGDEPAGIKRWMTTTVDEITYYHVIFGDPSYNTCSGDSGGPTFAEINGEEVVIGVTSFGRGGCQGTSNMTRTDTYQVFLDEVIAAWSGPCPADEFCDQGCVVEDPDCDPCRFEGSCAENCQRVDLDCPIAGLTGDLCEDQFDCESRLCVKAPDDERIKFCSQPCDPAAPSRCINPLGACRDLDGSFACTYAGPTASAQGSACTSGDECRSGTCDAEQHICVEACTDSCSAGYVCEAGFCRLPGSGGGGCAAKDAGDDSLAALLTLALALLVRRRRRQSV